MNVFDNEPTPARTRHYAPVVVAAVARPEGGPRCRSDACSAGKAALCEGMRVNVLLPVGDGGGKNNPVGYTGVDGSPLTATLPGTAHPSLAVDGEAKPIIGPSHPGAAAARGRP